jgi:hypothetical protein
MENPQTSHSERRRTNTDILIEGVFNEVDKLYGSTGTNPRSYYNTQYARRLVLLTSQIAEGEVQRGSIRPRDKSTLQLAAAFTLLGPEKAEAELTKIDLSPIEVARIRQLLEHSSIPDEDRGLRAETDSMQQILDDAQAGVILDEDHDVFWQRAMNRWRDENYPDKASLTDEDIEGLVSYWTGFLENLRFNTFGAINLIHTETHLSQLRDKQARIEWLHKGRAERKKNNDQTSPESI